MTRFSGCAAVVLLFACTADRGPPKAVPDAIFDARIVDATGPDFGLPPAPEPGARLRPQIDDTLNEAAQIGLYAHNPANGQSVASGGDVPLFDGESARLIPVLVYAEALSTGRVGASESFTISQEHLRGRGLRAEDVGAQRPASDLVRRALLDNDRTAEAILVARLGGADGIGERMAAWAIEGLGGYLEPCERDRAFATALDPRFAEADCSALGDYLHRGDVSGLTPLPFAEVPDFEPALRRAAVLTLNQSPRGASTARAWARVLTRLVHRTLQGGDPDAWVLDLLDDSTGAHGGGDRVPPSAWVGAIGSSGYGGTHWLGRVRRGDETFVTVLQIVGHENDLSDGVAALVGGAWDEVMESREAWPPIPLAPRHGFHSAWVLPGEAADACDDAPARFDDQLRCRRDAAAGVFDSHSRVAVSTVFQMPPDLEIAWFWSDPDARRRRIQHRLDSGPWWVWTRGHRPLSHGEWNAVIYVNGDAQSVTPFTVR